MVGLISQLAPTGFANPRIDFHALAPELVLVVTVVVLVLLDSVKLERARAFMPAVINIGLLAALVPLITLAPTVPSGSCSAGPTSWTRWR